MKQQETETSIDLLKGTLLCDLSKLGWKRLYSVYLMYHKKLNG